MITMSRTIRLATAKRWRRNRRTTMRHWLRASTLKSLSVCLGPGGCVDDGTSVSPLGEPRPSAVIVGKCSANADPRIEDAVEDVGDQVEQDHDDGRRHEPG